MIAAGQSVPLHLVRRLNSCFEPYLCLVPFGFNAPQLNLQSPPLHHFYFKDLFSPAGQGIVSRWREGSSDSRLPGGKWPPVLLKHGKMNGWGVPISKWNEEGHFSPNYLSFSLRLAE